MNRTVIGLPHLCTRTVLAVDEFIATAPDARSAVIEVAVTLQWPSVRGLSSGGIAGQLGCSPATISVQ